MEIATVEDWLLETWTAYSRPKMIFDPWQAASLAQRLRRRGVRVVEHTFTASSNARLALTLHRLLRERALVLPDDPELRHELANVRLRETSPGVYRLDHDEGAHDDRAIALGLCAYHLTERRTPQTLGPEFAAAFAAANLSLAKPSIGSQVEGTPQGESWHYRP